MWHIEYLAHVHRSSIRAHLCLRMCMCCNPTCSPSLVDIALRHLKSYAGHRTPLGIKQQPLAFESLPIANANASSPAAVTRIRMPERSGVWCVLQRTAVLCMPYCTGRTSPSFPALVAVKWRLVRHLRVRVSFP